MSENLSHQWTLIIRVPVAEVYYALTQAGAWHAWRGEVVQLDPRVGGRLCVCSAGTCTSGAFTALETDQRVAFTWQGLNEPPLLVDIALAAGGDGAQATVTVTCTGEASTWTAHRTAILAHWTRALEDLQSVLETGYRVQRRPILGVMGGFDLTADTAARLGVPVNEGFQILEPIDGLGAQVAGLAKNDVIVEVSGKPTPNAATLGPVLEAYAPGDKIAVTFYRGAARMATELVLSARPMPAAPSPAADLAAAVSAIYTRQMATLAGLLDGKSEAQLTWTPDAVKWSAKHNIAHLFTTERAIHMWAARLQFSEDTDNWASHDETWVRAVADCYPTTAALVDALKQAQAETVAILAALPAGFVARKWAYAPMGSAITQGLPYHTDIHFNMIREVLTAAPAP